MKTQTSPNADSRPARSHKPISAASGTGTKRSPQAAASSDDRLREAVSTRVMRALHHSLATADPASLQQALEAATDAGSAAQLLSLTAGADASVRQLDPLAASIMRGAAMKQDLLARAGGCFETSDVARLLGISRQAVARRVQRGTLLALPDPSGNLRFPALQFTETGTVAGLETVLTAFTVESSWTRLALLLDTDSSLGGARLIDALRAGHLDAVLDVVSSFGA